MEKVSVIVAAKNEEKRISGVLGVVCTHPLVDEVVVICGGSTDKTAETARSFGVVVDDAPGPKGKTLAVKRGLEIARNNYITLLDADLVGLTAQHVTDLASPVLGGKVDFTLSTRQNSALVYKLFGIDFVSGERTISKKLLSDPLIWSKTNIGYSLEVLMNKTLLRKKKKFIAVRLPGLISVRKSQKENYFVGAWKDSMMVFQIFKVLPFYEVIAQLFKMAWLNRRYKKELREVPAGS